MYIPQCIANRSMVKNRRRCVVLIYHRSMNGKGVFTFPDGSEYEGEMCDGSMHGKGTLRLPSGARVEGTWDNGRITEVGQRFCDSPKHSYRPVCLLFSKPCSFPMISNIVKTGNIVPQRIVASTMRSNLVSVPQVCTRAHYYLITNGSCVFNFLRRLIMSWCRGESHGSTKRVRADADQCSAGVRND